MKSAVDLFKHCRILPVIALEEANDAVPLARALASAKLRVLEVTLRTEQAFAAIERIIGEVENVVVGAGTVTYPRQFEELKRMGVQFAVTPGFHEELNRAVMESELLCLPGVATVSEALQIRDWGYLHAKLFPAEVLGGTAWLRSVRSVLPTMNFFPTGGIQGNNMKDYLQLKNVVAVGGSWVCPRKLIQSKDWSGIQELASIAWAASSEVEHIEVAS